MWMYPDDKGNSVPGPPPVELLVAGDSVRIACREIEDLVQSDILAEDRGEDLLGLLREKDFDR